MGRFREEQSEIRITYTTDGEVVNRITGSQGNMDKQVLIAYLEQFCGVKVQNINKQSLLYDLTNVIEKHLAYDRNL